MLINVQKKKHLQKSISHFLSKTSHILQSTPGIKRTVISSNREHKTRTKNQEANNEQTIKQEIE